MIRKYKIGNQYKSAYGTVVTITEQQGNRSIVQIDRTNIKFIVANSLLRTSEFKTCMDRGVYGVGYLGDGPFTCRVRGGAITQEYCVWANMLKRCYTEYDADAGRQYAGVTVHPDWHNYQNFAQWYVRKIDRFQSCGVIPKLDKDLLSDHKRGNLYSPDNCCILPNIVNAAIIEKRNTNQIYHGVHQFRGKFRASLMHKGKHKQGLLRDTPEQALSDYIYLKQTALCELAHDFKHVLEPVVFNKLLEWEPSIL